MRDIKTLLIVVLLLTCVGARTQTSFFDTIPESGSPAALTLYVDIKKLVRTKQKEPSFSSNIKVEDEHFELILEGKVKARGNVRKQICFYPPISLKIEKSGLESHQLAPTNKYKLVLLCDSGDRSQAYLYRELLAYKIYNEICPYSFQAKPLTVHFVNPQDSSEVKSMKGFIIENEEEMAARQQAQFVNRTQSNLYQIDPDLGLIFSLFEFMIGNTDWSLINMHNTKVVKVANITKLVAVPYDFDYSGLVDAHYAVPDEKLKLADVVERYYLGLKCKETDFNKASLPFIEAKQRIFQLVHNFDYLTERDRQRIQQYLEEFYEILENPKKAHQFFVEN